MSPDYISYETLIATREAAYWAKLSMIGTWFSGIATFLAVITSLWIALRDRMPFIRGRVRYGRIITDDIDKPIIGVTVINRSFHSIIIKSICWDVGREYELQQLFRNSESDPLPVRLEHGEEANFRIILDDDDWLKRMALRLTKLNSHPKKLRCVIVLSTGERRRVKVAKRIKEKIQQFM
ncbi:MULTISPECIES: hypothetical protein [Klebsiella pneumoniae complex]|uniref:hypothetical protein n=1 Tax=Klebsiella pneumoniae complex TaxID=3390273 RepID=UPI000D74DF8A|nr:MULTISPECIES: hypothetical protein [Klebsiella]HED3359746.1 hypothetical protein [Klebsiella variicola subsp. variicola]AWX76226.1 hypothetical protein DQB70_08140 [Klebsiella variicola]EKT9139024.1 hypothetical protein [Klebsiella variicola]PXM19960.1 hypothetical protein DMT32_16000 [Klebsiella variicola]QFY21768.1 hypothetical protein C2D62_07940 [Klebsiella variicola]